MHFRRRLMAQQITFCPGIIIGLITFSCFFSDGKRDRTIRKTPMNLAHNVTHPVIGKVRIFASLQHKSTKSKTIPFFTARKYFLFCQTVSVRIRIISSNPAVIAVVFTIIGKFYQAANVHFVPIVFSSHSISRHSKSLRNLLPRCIDPLF